MSIKVFKILMDFIDKTKDYGLDKSNGLWNDIEVVDMTMMEILTLLLLILENNFYKPNMKMFVNDFDSNGFKEQIICYEIGGNNYPILDKDELIAHTSNKEKIVYYKIIQFLV